MNVPISHVFVWSTSSTPRHYCIQWAQSAVPVQPRVLAYVRYVSVADAMWRALPISASYVVRYR